MENGFCGQCGAGLRAGARFCGSCGAPVEEETGRKKTGGKGWLAATAVLAAVVLLGGSLLLVRWFGRGQEGQGTAPVASRELEGVYAGVCAFEVLENPDAMGTGMTPEEITLLQAVLGKGIPCRVEVAGNALDVHGDIPGMGEMMLLGFFWLDNLENGVLEEEEIMDRAGVEALERRELRVFQDGSGHRLQGSVETVVKGEPGAMLRFSFDVVKGEEQASDRAPSATTPEPAAAAFVPTPGTFYAFTVRYPSGESGVEKKYVGKATREALSTSVGFVPDPETSGLEMAGERVAYLEREDGVHQVQDGVPGEGDEVLWLPHDHAPGTVWETDMGTYTILETGVSLSAGGRRFEGCVVRLYENDAVGYRLTETIAPGHGVVRGEYGPGEAAVELLEISPVDLEHADSLWEQFR
ncbi:zinc ribbon domain-containing protein [Anaerotalea alkaliphila]|uniref:Zinc ribbon domain-containing protein n=1 Tax=Anaerotalea alkaliphila TaxID=2662126 RepID=A0A7X5KN99_9FIRM|nr:zinc ribbon domain-containing protein [Anaerotalea alkaliphila]NDL68776.1 zinc ribbon domain-containing protein [Anaerotalea alkaliphila]